MTSSVRDPYAFESGVDRYIARMSYGFYTGRWVTLKRPSWLHPYRRVMWVHIHGPHTPSVAKFLPSRRTMGVIKGITN